MSRLSSDAVRSNCEIAGGAGVRPAFWVKRDRPCSWGLFDKTLRIVVDERLQRFRALHRAAITASRTTIDPRGWIKGRFEK